MTLGGDSAVEKLLRQSAVASLQTGLEQGEPVAMHFSGNLLTLIPLAQQRERRSGWAMVVFDDSSPCSHPSVPPPASCLETFRG